MNSDNSGIRFKVLDCERQLVFKATRVCFDYITGQGTTVRCEIEDPKKGFIWLKKFKLLPYSGIDSNKQEQVYTGDIVEYEVVNDFKTGSVVGRGYDYVVFEKGVYRLNERSIPLNMYNVVRVVGDIYDYGHIFKCLECSHCNDEICDLTKENIVDFTVIACEMYREN